MGSAGLVEVRANLELCLSFPMPGPCAFGATGRATSTSCASSLARQVQEIGGRRVIVVQQGSDDASRVATIVLRASTEIVLSDLEVGRCLGSRVSVERLVGVRVAWTIRRSTRGWLGH
jgi:hypothetical protein